MRIFVPSEKYVDVIRMIHFLRSVPINYKINWYWYVKNGVDGFRFTMEEIEHG
jgi:hypothetical protein